MNCRACHIDSCIGCEPPPQEPVYTCDGCGEKIFTGDPYYQLRNAEIYCETCILLKIA